MLKEILNENKQKIEEGVNIFKLLNKEKFKELVANNKDIKDKDPVFTTMEKNGKDFLVIFDSKTNKMVGYMIDGETLQETPTFVTAFFKSEVLS